MLSRWVLKLLEKEHALRTDYHRAHPHFLRYLLLDAILSVGLVVGGYQLFFTHSVPEQVTMPLGVSVVSADKLANSAKSLDMDAYWLGPVSDYGYTMHNESEGIVDIFYWPESAGTSDDKAFLYEVKTYASKKIWDSHTHPILAKANTTKIAVNRNISITINRSSMRGVIVTYLDKPEIVALRYPKPQSLKSMVENVMSLKLVE